MERRKIATAFDDHDYKQLVLLAKMNKVRPSELVRHICKAYLDGRKVVLCEETKRE